MSMLVVYVPKGIFWLQRCGFKDGRALLANDSTD
jgi:hypothetical protein